MAKKQYVMEQLPWWTDKICYINLKFFETLKDAYNTWQGFSFVAFVVLEIGGWIYFDAPPWSPCIMCVQYIGRCSVHRGDTMRYTGDIMIHVGEQVDKSLWFILKTPMYWTSRDVIMISPTCIMISPPPPPRCTEHPSMYSWYLSDVLIVFPWCTEHPSIYSWCPSDVLLVSSRCTEHTLYRVLVLGVCTKTLGTRTVKSMMITIDVALRMVLIQNG